MFFTKGWKPLSQISREVYDLLDEKYRTAPSEWQTKGEEYRVHLLHFSTCDTIYWLLSEAEIGCMTVSGVVSVSREVVEPISAADWDNDHVDLTVGTIGSGRWSEVKAGQPPITEQERHRRYGPFLYAPIVVKEADYKKFMHVFETYRPAALSEQNAQVKGRMKAGQIARELVKLFDAGQFKTRSEAFALIRQQCLSVNQFGQGWGQARRERPDMAKPGRRCFS